MTGEQATEFDVSPAVEQRNGVVKDLYAEYMAAGESESAATGSTAPPPDLDLDDEELLEKARAAENGEKFSRLYRGDDSMHSNDTSRADLAFCSMLAFWTGGDRHQMDRIVRNSGRMRAKWDEPHYADGTTYGEGTIDEALSGVTEFYSPGSQTAPTPPAIVGETARDAETDGESDAADDDGASSWEHVRGVYAKPSNVPGCENKYARSEAVDLLLADHAFATPRDTDHLHYYDAETGVFVRNGETYVSDILKANLGPHYSRHERNEIVDQLKATCRHTRDEFNAGAADAPLLCVANGVLNLETRELADHSPAYLFTRRIAAAYDPDAACPTVDAFLDDITKREEDKRTMLEMVGHALWPRYDYEKFLILFGKGSNGKTTFFNVVTDLLGADNVAEHELQSLAENRFATADLYGKLANMAADMSGAKVTDVSKLKALTGGDRIMAERKGEQGFSFRNTATLMFGVNQPPAFGERLHSIQRRIVPVHLPYNFTTEADDGNPDAKKEGFVESMTTDEELSGLLNAALDGLDRLREHGDVSLPETGEERLEYYEKFSDPIKQFRVECLDNQRGYELPKAVVYQTYVRFCEANDFAPRDQRVFWRVLGQTTFTVDEYRPRVDGEQIRTLRAATLTSEGAQHIPPTMAHQVTLPFDDMADVDDTDRDDDADGDGDGDGDGQPTERSTVHDETPLADLSVADGYTTVTVEVLGFEENTAERGPAYSGTVRDATDMVDVIDFAGVAELAGLEAGKCYRISGTKLEIHDKYGPQLTFSEYATEVAEIQQGVGTTERGDRGANADLAESTDATDQAVTDGGATASDTPDAGGTTGEETPPESPDASSAVPDDATSTRADAVRLRELIEQAGSDGRLPRGELLAKATQWRGMDPETAETALATALTTGVLQEPETGVYEVV
ncbi:phage/plasmid primase, P4 family [Halomarina halobia]|uniref:phage/plasmid primase, P4 family n=1 Tax=Halomarina halobia TaxID=3033386 RepID=UPI0023E79367|nr:phage/plasmid primase, P4 family [Halomarina sp. PSR21]